MKVFACIDGLAQTVSVCDYSLWAARRLRAPLQFLHVLDRHPERASATDFSGTIGLGAQENLLEQLSALDEQRSKLAQEHGRQVLQAARLRAEEAGLTSVDTLQRHGELVENLLDLEPEARLVVLGQHQAPETYSRWHLDQNAERVVRSVQRPVLVVTGPFREPERFVIAFDGSRTGKSMVSTVAESPLLRGLDCHVIAADDSTAGSASLNWARSTLDGQGFTVHVEKRAGAPDEVVRDYCADVQADLLVMGAYGHSRIRHLIMGSTTSTLLRTSPVPVLVLR
ncbi:MAG: universal stress protein [Alcaligenaceae bacterium]|nr:universal stress protein [Alcaligenaceae bacterium]